eukprot:9561-Heterococcus_DN1.PRE.2
MHLNSKGAYLSPGKLIWASTKPPAARYRCTRATSQVSAAACSSFVSRGFCCETMLAVAMTILLIVSSTGFWFSIKDHQRAARQNSKCAEPMSSSNRSSSSSSTATKAPAVAAA